MPRAMNCAEGRRKRGPYHPVAHLERDVDEIVCLRVK